MQSLEMEFHPAADLFPVMSESEFQALKKDIAENGLQQSIVVRNGKIIDGRHRVRACNELGYDWSYHLVEYDDEEMDEVSIALSLNMHRRHLSQSQLAMVADKVRGIYDEEAKERRKKNGECNGRGKKEVVNLPPPKKAKARDKAAETVGVSGSLADAARTVRRNGSDELIEAVESGDVAVTAAADVAKEMSKSEQSKAVKTGQVKKKAAEIRRAKKSPTAAKVAANEVLSIVRTYLKTKPEPADVEPVLNALDQAQDLVETAIQ